MARDLESQGWRQGSLARPEDIVVLVDGIIDDLPAGADLVIISQSCDLARHEQLEPQIEAIVSREIDRIEGNYTFAKNGRTLDLSVSVRTGTRDFTEKKHLRLQATDKIAIPKERFADKTPDPDTTMPMEAQNVLADWLSGRYSRPALPTDFNSAIESVDRNLKKLRRMAKRMSPHTAGIYADIVPFRDLTDGEKYRVNLLAMVIPSAKDKIPEVEKDAKQLKTLLESAGMDVDYRVQSEDQVPVSTVKRMKRVYLDDLSHRYDHPLPARP